MGLFSKKQKEFRTHSFKSKWDYVKEMGKAKKAMTKKQFDQYQKRLTENLFFGQTIQAARAKGQKVQINPQSPKLRKFIIG